MPLPLLKVERRFGKVIERVLGFGLSGDGGLLLFILLLGLRGLGGLLRFRLGLLFLLLLLVNRRLRGRGLFGELDRSENLLELRVVDNAERHVSKRTNADETDATYVSTNRRRLGTLARAGASNQVVKMLVAAVATKMSARVTRSPTRKVLLARIESITLSRPVTRSTRVWKTALW